MDCLKKEKNQCKFIIIYISLLEKKLFLCDRNPPGVVFTCLNIAQLNKFCHFLNIHVCILILYSCENALFFVIGFEVTVKQKQLINALNLSQILIKSSIN